MRLLHVNKFARITGGVESVVQTVIREQRRRGHDVALFSSEDVEETGFVPAPQGLAEGARTARSIIWNRHASAALERALSSHRPQLVHVHSVYHQLSPSVLATVQKYGVPTVLSLHDYKLIAPCYVLLRDGRRCTDCLGRAVAWPSVMHRCVKGSAAGSFVCTAEDLVHRRRYGRVPRLITVPSVAALRLHEAHGALPAAKLRITPWGFDRVGEAAQPGSSRTVLYAGRVSEEKGTLRFVQAWRSSSPSGSWRLQLLGGGPQLPELMRITADDPSVDVVGEVTHERVLTAIREAAAVVVPSLCEETFGMAALEAMAAGVPVAVSRIGALPELVRDGRDGWHVDPYDAAEWTSRLSAIRSGDGERERLGRNAAERARDFSEARMVDRLSEVYAEAMV